MACLYAVASQHTNALSPCKSSVAASPAAVHTLAVVAELYADDGGPGTRTGGIGQAGGTGAGGIGTGGGDLATVELAAKALGGGTGWWRQGAGLTASELASSGLAS